MAFNILANMLNPQKSNGNGGSSNPLVDPLAKPESSGESMLAIGPYEPVSSINKVLRNDDVVDLYFPVSHTVNEISLDLLKITFTLGGVLVDNSIIKKMTMWLVEKSGKETKFMEISGLLLRFIQEFKNQFALPNNFYNWGFGRNNIKKMLSPAQFRSVHVQIETNDGLTVGGVAGDTYSAQMKQTTNFIKEMGQTTMFPRLQERYINFGTQTGELTTPVARVGNLDTLWIIASDGDITDPTNWADTLINQIRFVGDGLNYLLQDSTWSKLKKDATNRYKYEITGMIPITFSSFPDLSNFENLDLYFIVDTAAADLQIKYIAETIHPTTALGGV